jgi:hypothetical protein
VLACKGEKYLNKEMPRERTEGFPPRANNNRPGEAWWILKARYKQGISCPSCFGVLMHRIESMKVATGEACTRPRKKPLTRWRSWIELCSPKNFADDILAKLSQAWRNVLSVQPPQDEAHYNLRPNSSLNPNLSPKP